MDEAWEQFKLEWKENRTIEGLKEALNGLWWETKRYAPHPEDTRRRLEVWRWKVE